MKKPGSAADPLWYKDALIYELHVKAFYDSNNDGIGDFGGLIQKLDYLQDLGVTCHSYSAVTLFSLGNSSDMFLVLRAQSTGIPAAAAPL